MPSGVYPRPARKRCKNHPDRPAAGRGLCRSCFYKCRRQENKPHFKTTDRKWLLKRKYGLTFEDFDKLLQAQGGHCAMCPTVIEVWKDGIQKSLAVDHDHKTGRVRGILCSVCNLLVGRIEAEPSRLDNTIKYLGLAPVLASLNIPDRYSTEINIEFLRGMCARMCTSFEKYGPIRDGFPEKINAIESLKLRLVRYEQTGNIEYLQDLGNFAMIEATLPRHPNAHFKAEDSVASPGRVHNTGLTSQAANTLQHENTRIGGFYKRDGD